MPPQPSHAPRPSPWAALALLMILGTIWGGGTSIAKYLSVSGVPPLGAVFWQTLGATVILLLVRLRSRHRRRLRLTRPLVAYFAFNGIVGLAIPSANMVFVTGEIPAGMMSVVLTLSPVLTYLGAMIMRLEVLNLRRGGGIALGFAGAMLLVLPSGSLPGGAVLSFALLAFLTPV
ncbi:MAG: EamA family transporter, partial [Alphaproteobacteria bacterium]